MKNKDKKEKNTNKRDNIFMIILSFCDVIASFIVSSPSHANLI